MAFDLGGEVRPSPSREFGYARLKIIEPESPLFKGLPDEMDVWMSHGDHVTSVPDGFRVTARTVEALNAMENQERQVYAVQFHPRWRTRLWSTSTAKLLVLNLQVPR